MPETFESEPTVKYPVRWWWLKRVSIALAILFIGLALLRGWWGWEAHRRLEQAYAAVRSAGEPATANDLIAMQVDVPDARNAAFHVRTAISAMAAGVESPAMSQLDYAPYPPFPPAWHRANDRAFTANRAVFPHLRQARAFREVDWDIPFAKPLINTPLRELNGARSLANLAGDASMRAHLRGNDAIALELLRDLRHLSYATDYQPTMVSHLVAIGIESSALQRLLVIAPGMRIDMAPSNGAPFDAAHVADGPAPRLQVETLIRELLDETEFDAALRRALLGERAFQFDGVEFLSQDSWLLRPMFELDAVRIVRNNAPRLAAAAVTSDWKKATAALQTENRIAKPPMTAVASELMRQDSRRLFDHQNRNRMERRFAAVTLAVQLYRADHEGAFPKSIQTLTPRYISRVPIDPFDPAGGPLRYVIIPGGREDQTDRPVVYSVADDGFDDTAAGIALPAWPNYEWLDGRRYGISTPDQWRDLSRWTKPPAPPDGPFPLSPLGGDDEDSGEAVDDDMDESDAPREDEQREGDGDDARDVEPEIGQERTPNTVGSDGE